MGWTDNLLIWISSCDVLWEHPASDIAALWQVIPVLLECQASQPVVPVPNPTSISQIDLSRVRWISTCRVGRRNTGPTHCRQRLGRGYAYPWKLLKIHARRDSPTFLGAIVAFVHFPKLKLRAQAEGDYRKMWGSLFVMFGGIRNWVATTWCSNKRGLTIGHLYSMHLVCFCAPPWRYNPGTLEHHIVSQLVCQSLLVKCNDTDFRVPAYIGLNSWTTLEVLGPGSNDISLLSPFRASRCQAPLKGCVFSHCSPVRMQQYVSRVLSGRCLCGLQGLCSNFPVQRRAMLKVWGVCPTAIDRQSSTF